METQRWTGVRFPPAPPGRCHIQSPRVPIRQYGNAGIFCVHPVGRTPRRRCRDRRRNDPRMRRGSSRRARAGACSARPYLRANMRSVSGRVDARFESPGEFAQCFKSTWGAGRVPERICAQRGLSAAACNGAPPHRPWGPRGWLQTANGALPSATWAPSTAVAAGARWRLADGRAIQYCTGGSAGATRLAAIGELGNDGEAELLSVSLSHSSPVLPAS